MKIRLGAMIFYGILKALFYLVGPLIVIYLLNEYTVIQVSYTTILGILILGIIGTIVTILNHTFEKDTVAHGYTSIIDSIYSAVFLFYLFGGFSLGDGFGYYGLDGELLDYYVSARIGLQMIAYLLMIGAGMQVFRHIVKTIELYRQKEYDLKIKDRKFHASTFIRILGVLVNIALIGYIISVPVSALFIRFNIIGDGFSYSYDPGSNPLDISDDKVNMSLQFSVDNQGVYSILDVRLDVDILVRDCTNGTDILIPDNTRIGGSADYEYNFMHFTTTTSENFTMSILPGYVAKLVVCNATLVFEISFEGRYAQLTADVDLSFTQEWTNKTYIP